MLVVLAAFAAVACVSAQMTPPPNFLSLLDGLPIKNSCKTSAKLFGFAFNCAPKLYETIMPVVMEVQSALQSPCIPDPNNVTVPNCSVEDLGKLSDAVTPLLSDVKKLVSALCDSNGAQRSCYAQLIELMKECVDDKAKEAALPDGLSFEEAVDAANLLCDKDAQQESCGVKIIEMFMEQDEVLASTAACATIPSGVCSADCKKVVSAFKDQLGCCWADLMHSVDTLNQIQGSTIGEQVDNSLPEVHGAWRLCGVEEPATTCDGKITLKYDADGHVVIEPGTDASSGSKGKSHAKVIAGAIAGVVGIAAVAIVVFMFVRSRKPKVAYQPVNNEAAFSAETDDETMVSM